MAQKLEDIGEEFKGEVERDYGEEDDVEPDHDERDYGEQNHGGQGHGEQHHDKRNHAERDHGERDHGEQDHLERDHGVLFHDDVFQEHPVDHADHADVPANLQVDMAGETFEQPLLSQHSSRSAAGRPLRVFTTLWRIAFLSSLLGSFFCLMGTFGIAWTKQSFAEGEIIYGLFLAICKNVEFQCEGETKIVSISEILSCDIVNSSSCVALVCSYITFGIALLALVSVIFAALIMSDELLRLCGFPRSFKTVYFQRTVMFVAYLFSASAVLIYTLVVYTQFVELRSFGYGWIAMIICLGLSGLGCLALIVEEYIQHRNRAQILVNPDY